MVRHGLFLVGVLVAISATAISASRAPVRARHAMVVSANEQASEVGVRILKHGGNAVDAAVAVGFALAVVFPEAGNIGGGGFMLVHRKDGTPVSIDFREKAPKSAWRTMYLDSAGAATDRSVNGCLSVAVPGTVAGFVKALEEYGTMSLRDVIQPAIDIARRGFVVDQRLQQNLEEYTDSLKKYPSTAEVFFRNNRPLQEGDTLRLTDLAATLERVRDHGNDGFYRGETARLIVEEVRRGNGVMTAQDLDEYRAIIRKPVKGTYRGYEILSTAPPSSGGICLINLLNYMEGYDLASAGYHSSRSVHLMTEAMKRVFADRSEYFGDPDFVKNPVEYFVSKEYAGERRSEIDSTRATPAALVRPGIPPSREGQNTTHYVVTDEKGNLVTTTYTINDLFGSKVVVAGAGFFLNDEMDDFSSKPGAPNLYGLLGGEANAIAPERRPLSSITPTVVLKDGKPIMALGARGGSKIITSVFQTIVNVLDFGMNIQEAVDAPRFHHQWLPDTILFEQYCFPEDVVQHLKESGHVLREEAYSLGMVEAILMDPRSGWIYGASDPREGGAAAGY